MSYYKRKEDDGEDFDLESSLNNDYSNRDCLLFAIDCNESMLQANEDGDVPVIVALESIKSTILHKVTTRPSDQVGIILFGTRESKNAANKNFIYVLQSLETPDAPRIKELEFLIENPGLLAVKYGSTDKEYPIGDLFWICSDIFPSTLKNINRRLFLITNNDDPTGENTVYRKTSIMKAKDLALAGTEVRLFGLNKSDHSFDPSIFYKDVLPDEDDDEAGVVTTQSFTGKLQELLNTIKSNQTKLRSEFRVPFEIAPGLVIGIRGYNMVIEQKINAAAKLVVNAEQIRTVKTITKWVCQDTKEYLTPTDINHAYEYGGSLIAFTKGELEKIKQIREPSILILGYRDKKSLMPYLQISHPYFIYPDESVKYSEKLRSQWQYQGSNSTFFTLLHSLLKKERFAVCSFTRRTNTGPRVVALLPQAEKLDREGNQVDPPGFQLITLPFAEDIRPTPNLQSFEPDDQRAIELIESIIDKLQITEGYNPEKYPNPSLSNHRNLIQTIALEAQREDERLADKTVPDYQLIEKKVTDEIRDLKALVELTDMSLDDLYITQSKRKPEAIDADGSKRIKAASMVEDLYHQGCLKRATVAMLKDYLASIGVPSKKKKDELIDQVMEHLSIKSIKLEN